MRLAYITDIEGQWHKLVDFVRGNPFVQLHGDALTLTDDTVFIFGGDVIDRGPHARRLIRTFLDAKKRYKDRVILLAGNRDINKLRLWRELQGHTPYPVPADVRALSRPEFLRWIFRKTMNTPYGVEFRKEELGTDDEEAVVDSFLADVRPGGAHVEYLLHCQLAFRYAHTLFVHGAVTDENLHVVPEHAPLENVDAWIAALNAWYLAKLDVYVSKALTNPPNAEWASLIAYQAPIFPTRLNQASVVYSRHSDDAGNPLLPSAALQAALLEQGISRVVVGHTPGGDTPALLRTQRFQWLIADNSYSPLERGSRVIITPDALHIAGYAKLSAGDEVQVDFSLRDEDKQSPVGLRVPNSRYLVKAPLPDAWLLGRPIPEFRVDQIRQDKLPTLEEAWA